MTQRKKRRATGSYLSQIHLDGVAKQDSANGSSETRRRLLSAAVELFGVRGYDACTMRDIAQAIGVTAPAIYNHYRSKQLLLVSAVDYILSDFMLAVLYRPMRSRTRDRGSSN